MKMMKAGIIGVGGRGAHAYNAHLPENGWEITAGMDVNPKAREAFKEKFPNAAIFDNVADLLKQDLDAVFVMSPDFMHEEQGLAVLNSGKALYLEKPMAITVEGCDRLLETARRTGSKLFIGHNMRHFPVILKMKEIIDSGLIGDIQVGWCRHFVSYGGDAYFRDWHSEQKNATGLLLQKGAHDIDVMHWLMGSYTTDVTGMGMLSVYDKCERRPEGTAGSAQWSDAQYPPLAQTGFSPVIDVEDHNMVMMQLENGAQASYMQCHYTPDAERNYTFIGTKGRVENIGDYDTCEVHVWTQRGTRANPDIIHYLKPKSGSHGGSDPDIVQNFLDFVRTGKKTNTSPVAARNAVAVGVLAHQSMRTDGGRKHIPELPADLIAYFENGQQK